MASWILIALLARLSDTARRPPPRPIQDEGLTQVVTLWNRALRRISIAVLVMFVLLLINVNYLQGFEPPAWRASRVTRARSTRRRTRYERGSIVTADGVTIAASKPSSNSNDSIKYQRYYPFGNCGTPAASSTRRRSGDGAWSASRSERAVRQPAGRFNGGIHDLIYAKPQLVDGRSIIFAVQDLLHLHRVTKDADHLEGATRAGRLVVTWICL